MRITPNKEMQDLVNTKIGTPVNAVASQGTLELTGTVLDGETFRVGSETFEIDTDSTVTAGNIAIDVSTFATASQGTLTVDTQPIIGDTFTIGVGAGSKVYTFVAELDADADGEVGIGADLAAAQLNIVAAINGTDGFNVAHTQVTAGAFAADDSIITAIVPGTPGDLIATTETFFAATNIFDAATLGTTTAGVDCPAADADGQIISDFNAGSTVLVTASQGAGTTIIFTADVKGVAGDLIPTTDTLSHGSFDDVTLGTTTAGVNGTVAQAGDIWVDATHIYIPTADNTIADANWRKIAHIAL